jgi:hypothetical protein
MFQKDRNRLLLLALTSQAGCRFHRSGRYPSFGICFRDLTTVMIEMTDWNRFHVC